jgi:hypothetical protein
MPAPTMAIRLARLPTRCVADIARTLFDGGFEQIVRRVSASRAIWPSGRLRCDAALRREACSLPAR